MSKYEEPALEKEDFTCPHCGVHSQFERHYLSKSGGNGGATDMDMQICTRCKECLIWKLKPVFSAMGLRNSIAAGATGKYEHKLIYPISSIGELPHDDMPEDVKEIYEEARQIAGLSPRGAIVLLRLALDRLVDKLLDENERNKKLRKKIELLTKRGLSSDLSKAMDAVRNIGNGGAHDNELSEHCTKEVALKLFGFINFLVEQKIKKPREIGRFCDVIPEGRQINKAQKQES